MEFSFIVCVRVPSWRDYLFGTLLIVKCNKANFHSPSVHYVSDCDVVRWEINCHEPAFIEYTRTYWSPYRTSPASDWRQTRSRPVTMAISAWSSTDVESSCRDRKRVSSLRSESSHWLLVWTRPVPCVNTKPSAYRASREARSFETTASSILLFTVSIAAIVAFTFLPRPPFHPWTRASRSSDKSCRSSIALLSV